MHAVKNTRRRSLSRERTTTKSTSRVGDAEFTPTRSTNVVGRDPVPNASASVLVSRSHQSFRPKSGGMADDGSFRAGRSHREPLSTKNGMPVPPPVPSAFTHSSSSTSSSITPSTVLSESEMRRVSRSKGLMNLGNTCYMATVLQCLFATSSLRRLMLNNGTRVEAALSHCTKKNSMRLTLEFLDLMKAMGGGGGGGGGSMRVSGGSVAPTRFKRALAVANPMFNGASQHDAHECLRMIVDGLHEALNRITGKPIYREMDNPESTPLPELAAQFAEYEEERGSSVITDMFRGQLLSQVTCGRCGGVSSTFDAFMDLSVPVPSGISSRSAPKTSLTPRWSPLRRRSSSAEPGRSGSSGGISLIDCMKAFVAEEELDNGADDAAYCRVCKKHRPATKKMAVYQWPMMLVVQLKRFTRRSKVDTPVSFPIEGLDLSEFTGPGSEQPEAPIYDLYAVAHHIGSLWGGHYVASTRSTRKSSWYRYNDESVSSISSHGDLGGRSAYVLFYKRR